MEKKKKFRSALYFLAPSRLLFPGDLWESPVAGETFTAGPSRPRRTRAPM